MKQRRKFLVNQKVRAVITFLGILVFTIIVVFIGVESLRYLPYFSETQKKFLNDFRYPPFLKFLVIVLLGIISSLSAFFFVYFKNAGFLTRLSKYLDKLKKSDSGKNFHFREKDAPSLIKGSFQSIISKLRTQMTENTKELRSIRDKAQKLLNNQDSINS